MKTWNDYWKSYQVSTAERWLQKERNAIIDKYICKLTGNTTKRILEVACGYGSNIRMLQKINPELECHALDYSDSAVENVQREVKNTVQGYCRVTPFVDNHFNIIFHAGLMEHLGDERLFLVEMKRILKNTNSYMITFVPARYSLWRLYIKMHFGLWKHGRERSYSHSELTDLFTNNGFEIIEISGIDPFSINGFLMKLFNFKFKPFITKSPFKSGYTELCVVCKRLNFT